MHTNSLAAYASLGDGKMTRAMSIIKLMLDGISRTDRQIMKALGFTDMNAVRPRVTELIKKGVLEEICTIKDEDTGKPVRVVQIKQQQTSIL